MSSARSNFFQQRIPLYREDIVLFAREVLRFEPDDWQREVMEEVGLKVKDLKYFGSQPWGFSDSLITGFFASLEGSDAVTVDRSELSEAVWMHRDELPQMKNDMSITAVMIEAFRKGEI